MVVMHLLAQLSWLPWDRWVGKYVLQFKFFKKCVLFDYESPPRMLHTCFTQLSFNTTSEINVNTILAAWPYQSNLHMNLF